LARGDFSVPLKAKFHYTSWFGAGSELKFGLSSSLLAANTSTS